MLQFLVFLIMSHKPQHNMNQTILGKTSISICLFLMYYLLPTKVVEIKNTAQESFFPAGDFIFPVLGKWFSVFSIFHSCLHGNNALKCPLSTSRKERNQKEVSK